MANVTASLIVEFPSLISSASLDEFGDCLTISLKIFCSISSQRYEEIFATLHLYLLAIQIPKEIRCYF